MVKCTPETTTSRYASFILNFVALWDTDTTGVACISTIDLAIDLLDYVTRTGNEVTCTNTPRC